VRALGAGGDRTDPGAPELPRRVRQANLAPQLRDATPAPGPAGTGSPTVSPAASSPATGSATTGSPTTGPPTIRPPEETRSLMTSLQEGWKRGREEEEPDE
jgi:hypothetical protein